MNNHLPWYVAIAFAAWFCTGVYFIVSMLRTKRIEKKEAGGTRAGDRLLIWGGYICLFLRISRNGGPWDVAAFIAPAWRLPLGIAGAVVAVAGLAYTCWARAALGEYWSGIVALKHDHKLVRSGPYRRVRHPLYTGLMAASLGTAFAFGLWRALLGAALLWTAFIARAHREDALLAGQFGEEFADYRRSSGRLWPRLS